MGSEVSDVGLWVIWCMRGVLLVFGVCLVKVHRDCGLWVSCRVVLVGDEVEGDGDGWGQHLWVVGCWVWGVI